MHTVLLVFCVLAGLGLIMALAYLIEVLWKKYRNRKK